MSHDATGDGATDDPGRKAPAKSTKRMFAVSILAFELFVVFFACLVAYGLRPIPVVDIAIGGGGIIVLAMIAMGLLRLRIGYLLGHIVQLALIASGLVVPMMYLVGVLFAAAWGYGLYAGGRVDREKAAYARLYGAG